VSAAQRRSPTGGKATGLLPSRHVLDLDPNTIRVAVTCLCSSPDLTYVIWPPSESAMLGWYIEHWKGDEYEHVAQVFAQVVASLFPESAQARKERRKAESKRHRDRVNTWLRTAQSEPGIGLMDYVRDPEVRDSLRFMSTVEPRQFEAVWLHLRHKLGREAAEWVRTDLGGTEETDGATWDRLLDTSEFLYPAGDGADDTVLLGKGDEILHIAGQAGIACSMTGVGKSTLGQNYVLHRARVFDGTFLGLAVHPLGEGEAILYVAADRPTQIRRSFRRMVSASEAEALREHLVMWWGPLPFVLNDGPLRLVEFVREVERRRGVKIVEVILDSLKDVTSGLHKPEGAEAVAHAFTSTVAEGIDLLALHHDRKTEKGKKRTTANITIDDVYGGTFLTAGAGNVWYLLGAPGAETFSLLHLKQAAEPVGPLAVTHDHRSGIIDLGTAPAGAGGVWRPTGTMERVSKLLGGWAGAEPPTQNEILAAINVKRRTVEDAVRTLVAEGYVNRWREGRAYRHGLLKPYVAADDPFDEHGELRGGDGVILLDDDDA
jgi:hypothetical protein